MQELETTPTFRAIATDAIRYWEPWRILYNAVLSAIVLGYFFAAWPASKSVVSLNGILFVFLLAVLANAVYCAAYLADVFVQLSGFRDRRGPIRLSLLVLGILFASVITRFFALGFFHSAD